MAAVTASGADRGERSRVGNGPGRELLPSGNAARNDLPVTLDQWQARLTAHFDDLSRQRQKTEWPLFALEHGLAEGERQMLAAAIAKTAAIEESLLAAPLAWVVYAAEIGYQYSGEEYWRTFSNAAPKWTDTQRDRDRVRAAFRNFARRYAGAEPDGAWAEQFGIIAWPITHSILPRDLQRQLAELLYDARLTFREETFASAESLGRHLAGLSRAASSRFRQLAKDSALLGQIAFALLLHDGRSTSLGASPDAGLIYGPTLERIIGDLNRERDAREWLIEARSAARFRLRGLSHIPYRQRDAESATSIQNGRSGARDADEDLRRLLGRPRFLLRQTPAKQWHVWVQFPNLAPLVAQLPRARDVLARTQGRVGGPGGPVLASGRILSESWPGVRLGEWPVSGGSLLRFDGAPPEVRGLLDASFRVPPGDDWLFLIGADGQARELSTRMLRSGESYLLLRRTQTVNPAGGLIPVDVLCAGVFGLRIDVPIDVPDALLAVLEILRLEVAQTLEVWPAGLPVPDWSGDGSADVLADEVLTLAVRTDRVLTAIAIGIDDNATVTLPIAEMPKDTPLFVTIPPLQAGRHRIEMTAVVACERTVDVPNSPISRHRMSTTRAAGLSGSLALLVRTPRANGDGAETGALSFAVHPRAPSLEDVWEDRCELHVSAPGAATIRCRVDLIGKDRARLARRDFGLPSPVTTAVWREEFRRHVRDVVDEFYDEAHACAIEFNAGSIGRGRLLAERDFTPLRWIVRDGGGEVALVDSRGEPGISVFACSCRTPDISYRIDASAVTGGWRVPPEGALLVAQSGSAVASVVAVPKAVLRSFADMAQPPEILAYRKEPAELEGLVRLALRWETARLGANSLTQQRRDAGFGAIHSKIVEVIAGERWHAAELAYNRSGNVSRAVEAMRALVSTRPDERGLAVVLSMRAGELAGQSAVAREEMFAKSVATFVRSDRAGAIAPFALRLAASPKAAVEWSGIEANGTTSVGTSGAPERQDRDGTLSLQAALSHLLEVPVVLRAARLAVVLLDAETQTTVAGISARDHRVGSRNAWTWT
jgi:hypothetical protein